MTRLLAIMCILLAACCPCRNVASTTSEITHQRDSLRVVHIDTIRVVERDTVIMGPISQAHDKVAIMTTNSYLENEYCTSRANVDELGILTHTLDTRDSALLPMRLVEVASTTNDILSHISEHDNTSQTTAVEIKEVNHVTWWQRTQIIGFWALLGVLAINYRKVIFKVITGWRI